MALLSSTTTTKQASPPSKVQSTVIVPPPGEQDTPSALAADAPQTAFLMVAAQQAEDARIAEEARVAEEARQAEEARAAEAARQASIQQATVQPQPVQRQAPTADMGSSLAPCGGTDYPPCYVAARESGGSYTAYNPGGCGGTGCYGKWQFGGFWAGKLGLPVDIWNATPEQQDNAARTLWAGGAGCSNWSAC